MKKIEVIVYETVDGVSRIEYKNFIIQTYGYEVDKDQDLGLCHFVVDVNGEDVCELFCLLDAIKLIDKLVKKQSE